MLRLLDMRRVWLIACAVFACFVAIVIAVEYRSTHPRVPPPLEGTDCSAIADLPSAIFERKGGRITRYVKVWREGKSLRVENVTQGRDLAKYDTLEVADPEPRVVADKRREPFLAQARSFVWEHWRDRKRGYLILTLSSVDATGTSHIFVENDDIGRWRVYRRIIHRGSTLVDVPTSYGVRWVRQGKWGEPTTRLGEDETPDPKLHRLQFRDSCGNWEGAF